MATRAKFARLAQKRPLGNVSESGESEQTRLVNVGESGEYLQSLLMNVGASKIGCFMHNLPNSPNWLNSCKTCQTCLSRVWRVLAKWFGECQQVWRVLAKQVSECWRVCRVRASKSRTFLKKNILANSSTCQKWWISVEYSNSLNSRASGHSFVKT